MKGLTLDDIKKNLKFSESINFQLIISIGLFELMEKLGDLKGPEGLSQRRLKIEDCMASVDGKIILIKHLLTPEELETLNGIDNEFYEKEEYTPGPGNKRIEIISDDNEKRWLTVNRKKLYDKVEFYMGVLQSRNLIGKIEIKIRDE